MSLVSVMTHSSMITLLVNRYWPGRVLTPGARNLQDSMPTNAAPSYPSESTEAAAKGEEREAARTRSGARLDPTDRLKELLVDHFHREAVELIAVLVLRQETNRDLEAALVADIAAAEVPAPLLVDAERLLQKRVRIDRIAARAQR